MSSNNFEMGVTLSTLTCHANYICVGQKRISLGPIFRVLIKNNVDVCPTDVKRKISVRFIHSIFLRDISHLMFRNLLAQEFATAELWWKYYIHASDSFKEKYCSKRNLQLQVKIGSFKYLEKYGCIQLYKSIVQSFPNGLYT